SILPSFPTRRSSDLQDTIQYTDSTVYSFYFYPRSLLFSHFQKKYINTPLPRIKLSDLNDNMIDTDELRGKIIMINFWLPHAVRRSEEHTSELQSREN